VEQGSIPHGLGFFLNKKATVPNLTMGVLQELYILLF